jgi:hypothetical protein
VVALLATVATARDVVEENEDIKAIPVRLEKHLVLCITGLLTEY